MAAVVILDPGLPTSVSKFSRDQKYLMQVPATTGPAAPTELYHFRGRDSGAPGGTVAYVTWFGSTTNEVYTGTPPYGGPIVDIVFRRIK